jgi:hypothetical protein
MVPTEIGFTLPCGYRDEQGEIHRRGTMRRASAIDEVAPLADGRVRANEAYLGVLLLSRVLTSLGPISPVNPQIVERLFATDYLYLQELYARLNVEPDLLVETECPTCRTRFALDVSALAQHAEDSYGFGA